MERHEKIAIHKGDKETNTMSIGDGHGKVFSRRFPILFRECFRMEDKEKREKLTEIAISRDYYAEIFSREDRKTTPKRGFLQERKECNYRNCSS